MCLSNLQGRRPDVTEDAIMTLGFRLILLSFFVAGSLGRCAVAALPTAAAELRQPTGLQEFPVTPASVLLQPAPEEAPGADEIPAEAHPMVDEEAGIGDTMTAPGGVPARTMRRRPAPPQPPKPWTLPQPGCFQRCGIKMGGWLQHGITLNGWWTQDRFNGPVALNDRNAEYQMNQLWLFFDRPTDTGGYGFDIGGHIDVVYGTDWRFGRFFGLENRINGDDQIYGLVLPQMYAEVAYNDLKVKLGHMAGILGYELVPAVGNFFYSHSYAMSYTEPQLITGLLGEYKLSDQWLLLAGFHQGWYMFEDMNDYMDVIGGFKWSSVDKRTKAAFTFTNGRQDPTGKNWFAYSLVFERAVTDKFKYVAQHNLGYADNLVGQQDAEWYGLNQYFLYTINPEWSAGMRFEWLRDDDGGRVNGIGNWLQSGAGWQGGPGYAGNFYALTLGLNWRPNPNLVFRPEVRWDWYDGLESPINADYPLPFNDGQSTNQFLIGMDMIVTF
jgi:hypothetical protein